MLDWLSRWQTLFSKSANDMLSGPAGTTQAKQIWELPTSAPPSWSPAETRILAQCEHSKTICTITNSSHGTPLQTVVLGNDPATNQLLLDDFFPRPATSPVGDRFQLSLPMGKGLMLLQVVVREEMRAAPAPVYVAEVVDKTTVTDRRQSQRLCFSSAMAPRVDLLIPLSPRLRGHLLDLSEGGFAMVFYGAAKPKLFARAGDCRIEIDEDFVLRPKVLIQQVRTHRKPFPHTVIRLRFVDLAAADKDKLATFIQNCTTQTPSLSAA